VRWRKLLGKIAPWLLPMGVYTRALEWRLRHSRPAESILPADLVTSFASNAIFRGRHQGQRCFILATGPSIRQQDLTGLAGQLCIAVSHFFLHEDLDTIAPRYHVVAPYHPPFKFDAAEKLIAGLTQAYARHDVDIFFGYRPYEYSTYDFLRQHPEYRSSRMHFVNYTGSAQLDETNVGLADSWDLTKGPFAPRTVTYSAIQLAVFMGCSEIYLLGCDHDYLNDIKRVTDHHFYAEAEGVSDAQHLGSFTLERWFEEYYYRWKQYRLMRQYVEARGGKIWNATLGGMLDVFPRVSLPELLRPEVAVHETA